LVSLFDMAMTSSTEITKQTPKELRARRVSAYIPGPLLSKRAGISGSRLSKIERGYVEASADELSRLGEALSALISAREKVAAVAETVGWPFVLLGCTKGL
jgi:transcriptional regulator with XRE-family HTH domain